MLKTLSDIRSTFLDYFSERGHTRVPSSSLIPYNDPTLLFTSAGMVQFKDVFTGAENKPYQRAVSSQKCLRAGGKHNDLENVGYTARHHTFFEMLGNFSFGDYFKEEAIAFAWEFTTKSLQLNPERLWITVYADDNEAAQLWRRVAGVAEERILRIATSDNFWSMGDQGPCGPCSEIFFDHGDHLPGGLPGTPQEDGDRFIEIWNLVFMQYDQQPDGTRLPLPKPSIDTGMGLERITAVLQGVHNNYQTDLFRRLIQASQEITRQGEEEKIHAHRVIADHIRACSFLITEGILPSNEGRGYVLRRIMRRAMRYGHLLGVKEPFFWKLVDPLVQEMGIAYPELRRAQLVIEKTLEEEETRFRQTLERGMALLETTLKDLPAGKDLPGEVAFRLYDTYGFPMDLTQDILRAQGRKVDEKGFCQAMEAQKAQARASWVGSGEESSEALWLTLKDHHPPTEFIGYATPHGEGKVLALIHENSPVQTLQKGQEGWMIVNQTPFYAESGGQMGDTGTWKLVKGAAEGSVTTTLHKLKIFHVHRVTVQNGSLKIGDEVILEIDLERRAALKANHSATHLLHAALRRCLGPHVVQKGSLVAPDRLRFDFSHNNPLTWEQREKIEQDVQEQIQHNVPVTLEIMDSEAALAKGAMALFGEKYGDAVRVVSMGRAREDLPYSMELCGGTHVNQTGDIGCFKILSDVGVSAGVRRIEAVTGTQALATVQKIDRTMNEVLALLKGSADQLILKVQALLQERKSLEKQVNQLRQKVALQSQERPKSSEESSVETVGALNVMVRTLQDIPPKDLKGLADQLKKEIGSGVVILTNVEKEKVSLLVGVTQDLIHRVSAIDLVRKGSQILGGKGGGGRPDLAQAGGEDPIKIPQAIQVIKEALNSNQNEAFSPPASC